MLPIGFICGCLFAIWAVLMFLNVAPQSASRPTATVKPGEGARRITGAEVLVRQSKSYIQYKSCTHQNQSTNKHRDRLDTQRVMDVLYASHRRDTNENNISPAQRLQIHKRASRKIVL